MSGHVITFYSYKGGVGRTMALSNVAVLLARWGHRVLVIDWDLEAPGLHLYLRRLAGIDANAPGLVELVEDSSADWRRHVQHITVPEAKHKLDLMAAGRIDATYVARMQNLDWETLYRDHALGNRLEQLRTDWINNYDFVLIDSRTGVTDSGGICTIHLPDQLVLFFTANEQSVSGTSDIARRALDRHANLPYDRTGLACIPVATRFDTRVEGKLAFEWLERFARELGELYAGWAHRNVQARELLDFLRIPYVARFSFGEELPVLTEGTRDPESVGYSIETLAALLSANLADTDMLVAQRDAFVSRMRSSDGARPRFDVFVSHARADTELAKALAEALARQNVKTLVDVSELSFGANWSRTVDERLESSDCYVFVTSEDSLRSAWQQSELDSALRALSKNSNRQLIPLLVSEIDLHRLPGALRSFSHLRLRGGNHSDVEEVAQQILARLQYNNHKSS